MPDRTVVLEKVVSALQSVLDDATADSRPEHHLVDDLGFDSSAMASLTIALEDEFDDMLLLNDWIATANSPIELTIDSLVDYLLAILRETG